MYFNNGTGGNYPYETQTRTVTIEPNNQPTTPSNPSPADGTTGVSTSTSLFWQGGDDPDAGDTVIYDVYFEAGDSTPDVIVCDDATTKSCSPGTLSTDTTYYWKVEATDNNGTSTTGPVWSFTTESGGGPPPDPCEGVRLDVDDHLIWNNNFDELSDFVDMLGNWCSGSWNLIDVDIYAYPTDSGCTEEIFAGLNKNVEPPRPRDSLKLNGNPGDVNFVGRYTYPEELTPVGEKTDIVKKDLENSFRNIFLDYLEKSGVEDYAKYGKAVNRLAIFSAAISCVFPEYPPDYYLTDFTLNDKYLVSHEVVLDDPEEERRLPTYLEPIKRLKDGFIGIVVHSPVDIAIKDPDGKMVGALYQNDSLVDEINEFSNHPNDR